MFECKSVEAGIAVVQTVRLHALVKQFGHADEFGRIIQLWNAISQRPLRLHVRVRFWSDRHSWYSSLDRFCFWLFFCICLYHVSCATLALCKKTLLQI